MTLKKEEEEATGIIFVHALRPHTGVYM